MIIMEEKEVNKEDILKKSMNSAFRGGLAGGCAMVANVGALMWLRTTVNYQYRYGTSTSQAFKSLYSQGGIPRFYKGVLPALVQGPMSRFGDTAANTGVMTLMDNNDATKNLPVGLKTVFASLSAASFRIFLMPLDTCKTTMQVEGSIKPLVSKLKIGGPSVLYYGSLASATATFAGHYPWFFTFNYLSEKIPKQDDTFKELGRRGFIGFCSSAVSDTISNSIRVVKVYRQTNQEKISYLKSAKNIIKTDGIKGLMFRGLETKIIANGFQGLMFSILWKYFEELLK